MVLLYLYSVLKHILEVKPAILKYYIKRSLNKNGTASLNLSLSLLFFLQISFCFDKSKNPNPHFSWDKSDLFQF